MTGTFVYTLSLSTTTLILIFCDLQTCNCENKKKSCNDKKPAASAYHFENNHENLRKKYFDSHGRLAIK